MVSIEYANAYAEALEILKYIPREDYNKIPKDKIDLFTINANPNCRFKYNPQIDLNEQNTSKLTKTIIAILFRDYWATDAQREKILTKEKYDIQKQEKELSEKYSYDNLFKEREDETINDEKQSISAKQLAMVEYKQESFWNKIINKIKNIFRK